MKKWADILGPPRLPWRILDLGGEDDDRPAFASQDMGGEIWNLCQMLVLGIASVSTRRRITNASGLGDLCVGFGGVTHFLRLDIRQMKTLGSTRLGSAEC